MHKRYLWISCDRPYSSNENAASLSTWVKTACAWQSQSKVLRRGVMSFWAKWRISSF